MKRVDWEGSEQATLFDWAAMVKTSFTEVGADGIERQLTVADLLVWVPNGVGKLSPQVARKMRDQGLTAGFPDLTLPLPKGQFHGLYIEFKASPPHSAAVTESQATWVSRLKRLGYAATVCKGWTDAAQAISDYLTGRFDR